MKWGSRERGIEWYLKKKIIRNGKGESHTFQCHWSIEQKQNAARTIFHRVSFASDMAVILLHFLRFSSFPRHWSFMLYFRFSQQSLVSHFTLILILFLFFFHFAGFGLVLIASVEPHFKCTLRRWLRRQCSKVALAHHLIVCNKHNVELIKPMLRLKSERQM